MKVKALVSFVRGLSWVRKMVSIHDTRLQDVTDMHWHYSSLLSHTQTFICNDVYMIKITQVYNIYLYIRSYVNLYLVCNVEIVSAV